MCQAFELQDCRASGTFVWHNSVIQKARFGWYIILSKVGCEWELRYKRSSFVDLVMTTWTWTWGGSIYLSKCIHFVTLCLEVPEARNT